MINNISWTSYCYVLTCLLMIYYTVVVLCFYIKDLLQLLSSRLCIRKFRVAETSTSSPGVLGVQKKSGLEVKSVGQTPATLNPELSQSDVNTMYQALADELRAYLQQAGNAGAEKEELLYSIQKILHKYPTLKNSAFQQSIGYLIVFELKNKCSTYLNIEDVSGLWER